MSLKLGRAEYSTFTTLKAQRLCSCVLPLSPHEQSIAKGSQQPLDPIKKLLITANVEQDNERRPGSARQSDNREIMTSVAPFGL